MISLILGIILCVVMFGGSFVVLAYNKENNNNENVFLRFVEKFLRYGCVIPIILGIVFSSIYSVKAKYVGLINKKWGGPGANSTLKNGHIIATNGENGIQAQILRDGIHYFYYSWQYDITEIPLTVVGNNQIGILIAKDGKTPPPGVVFAPEWNSTDPLNAKTFLTPTEKDNFGYRGPQLTVLGPGEYPIHTGLFTVKVLQTTIINQGQVGVIKANVLGIPPAISSLYKNLPPTKKPSENTVNPGQVGVWNVPLPPGTYWLHPDAYQVTVVDVTKNQIDFLGEQEGAKDAETMAIHTKASDGIAFYIDNTSTYHIEPYDAPIVVATIGIEKVRSMVITQVRQTIRDKVGEQTSLKFVNQRVKEQDAITTATAIALKPYNITLDDNSIRDIYGDQLTALLKTQSDKEIAKQQKDTYVEQQKTALEQQKLNKAEQEAIEEKTLATATYESQRALQRKAQAITQAQAEAERVTIAATAEANRTTIQAKANADAITLKGTAEAERYSKIVNALGQQNATAIEITGIIKEEIPKIKLPDMLIFGGGSGGATSGIEARLLQLLGNGDKPTPPQK